jgi:hypothetical protein
MGGGFTSPADHLTAFIHWYETVAPAVAEQGAS